MKKLKNYQDVAISQLMAMSKMYFNTDDDDATIIFQAPTGSGKTFMMTNFMASIVSETDMDLCFLWVSIGDGELHAQSMRSVSKEIDPKMQCSLLEDEFFGTRNRINRNEIVFLNWEKIRNKDKETGEFTNRLMKDSESINFIEVLRNTRESGMKIILIIDECHSSADTQRALEIRDEIIRPFLTIEMSATPVLNDFRSKVVVDANKVIQEQMIKKEIIINDGIEKILEDEITSENLVLESAYQKRQTLKELYIKNKSNVNPLVLIQIPNSSQGEEKKESVIKFLKDKGIGNNQIAVWLSDEKINQEAETLNLIDGSVEYLIFKQAIDTGWDCPRAQILVKFRESNSIIFEIQTVGRILRMPEAKHYIDEELNKAYVYTNIKSIEIKKEVYNPNIIKSLCSKRKDLYENINLVSYYRNRIDFGEITSSYKIFFERSFCSFFGIKPAEDELTDSSENLKFLKEKGVKISKSKLDSVLSNVKVESNIIDKTNKLKNFDVVYLFLSDSDLETMFDNIIIKNLGGFVARRSISSVKTAIIQCFRKYLGIKPAEGGIILMQNIIAGNPDIFGKIIFESIEGYKLFHKEEVEKKSQGKFNDNWEVPVSRNYNPNTNVRVDSALSIYEPLYLPKEKNDRVDQLELDFINYLDNHTTDIVWFWKNGDEHMESNFGIKKEDGYTFQPDFIIKFKDGKIGIFDTKAVGYNENDNVAKSNALYRYVAEQRYNGKNLVGGIVIKDNGTFMYHQNAYYKSYLEDADSWDKFETLF